MIEATIREAIAEDIDSLLPLIKEFGSFSEIGFDAVRGVLQRWKSSEAAVLSWLTLTVVSLLIA
ncbi:MAG: hypothetical protein HRT77_10100 [Halioglobus sp.]|nr:hypothetical protein [Halioglobus sp.]